MDSQTYEANEDLSPTGKDLLGRAVIISLPEEQEKRKVLYHISNHEAFATYLNTDSILNGNKNMCIYTHIHEMHIYKNKSYK